MENVVTPAQLTTMLNDLSKKREVWENNQYKSSNDVLYGLIDEAYGLLQQMRRNRKLIAAANALLKQRNIDYQTNTSLETKIIKLIFGEVGKRAISYARALTTIANEKPEKQSTAAFITERGGIDEMRRTSTVNPNALTNEQLEKLADQALSNAKAVAPQFALTGQLVPDEGSEYEYSIAVVRQVSPGQGEIVCGVNNASLLKSVLVHVGKGLAPKPANKARATSTAPTVAVPAQPPNAVAATPPPTASGDDLEAA